MDPIKIKTKADIKNQFGSMEQLSKHLEHGKIIRAPGIKGCHYLKSKIDGKTFLTRMADVRSEIKKFEFKDLAIPDLHDLDLEETIDKAKRYDRLLDQLAQLETIAINETAPVEKEGFKRKTKTGTKIRKFHDKVFGSNTSASKWKEFYQSTSANLRNHIESLKMLRKTELDLSTQVNEDLGGLFSQVEAMAPDVNRALTCTYKGVKYKVWWNSVAKAAIIQRKENFLESSSIKENKLLIKKINNNYLLVVNGKPVKELSLEKLQLVEALAPQVESAKNQYDAIQNLENKINPKSLKLVFSFLKEEKKKYDFFLRNDLTARMRIKNVKTSPHDRSSTSNTRKKYYLDLEFKGDSKLSIRFSKDGQIISARVDGKKEDIDRVFSQNGQWNQPLKEGIQHFLETFAMKKDIPMLGLMIHPLVLSECPEAALMQLCKSGSFTFKSGVKFLNDKLQPGPGVDLGGPRRQVLGDLPRNLFDGTPQRTIKMHSQIPVLSNDPSKASEEKKVLENFGKMLAVCFKKQDYVVGRLFPDNYFGLIKKLMEVDLPLSDDQIIRLSEDEIASDENIGWMLEVYKSPRLLDTNEKETLALIGIDIPEDIDDPSKIKDFLKNCLLESFPYLRNRVLAAHAISQGLKSGITPVDASAIRRMSNQALSRNLQGIQFSREDIASRVKHLTNDPVVRAKAAWLVEIILDPNTSEEWIKSLLKTVTGFPSVTASTSIRINATNRDFCSAHTCTSCIDLPNKHVTNGTALKNIQPVDHLPGSDPRKIAAYKQYFKDNLQITMNETGFDMI